MSSSKKERSRTAKPVFDGANFDRDGNCIRHKSIQLAEHVKQDGRLLWKEIKMNCPKCVAEHHKSRRVTSLGGAGKVKRGRTVHGKSNPLRSPSKSGRHMDVQFDTPFDDKGRCHHHPNVQMASKRVRGGWKILVQGCPKCIEAKYDEDVELESVNSRGSSRASSRRSKYDNDDHNDNASASSKSTKRSVTSRTKPATSSGKFDKNGCCTDHPTVQVAKKKLLGVGGWKEFRSCPKCLDPSFDDMADNASVGSGRSNRSATSFRSRGSARSRRSGKSAGGNRSVKSNSSRKGGRKGDRYGALPFDEEGYCHAHPGVRLAKKKALGGWKVLHDICPDCAHDASSQAGSRSSKSSRGTGRYFDGESGGDATSDDASSYKSGKSSNSRKKKIRVKDMKYRDENGKDGRYSGDVDEDHSPHGQGKMKYKDGSVFVGVWSEGSQVHGKTTKSSKNKNNKAPVSNSGSTSDSKSRRGDKSSGSGSKKSGSKDWARIEDGKSNGGGKKGVRKMKWMDYYGDPGEYTGEVDSSQMPNGKGSMKYDHGLIQEGLWTKGQFVEGSDIAENGGGGEGGKKYKSKSSNGGRSGANSGRKTRSSGSSKRLEP